MTLWVTGRDVESRALRTWQGPTVRIGSEGFAAGALLRYPFTMVRLLVSAVRCRGAMRAGRPDALLAMGSYASVGPVVAARTLRVPVVLHEANAVPGRAVSALSRFADAVAISFPEAARFLRHSRIVFTGFPVRPDLADDGLRLLEPGRFTLLIMGGSQGARSLNEVCSRAVCSLHGEGLPVQVVHLAGARDRDLVESRYREAGVPHAVFDFLQEMNRAYHTADLAVCRAGAASCAELRVCALPALLVPLPSAQRDHQTANAASTQKTGGADVLSETGLTPDHLANCLRDRVRHPERLGAMRRALRSAAAPDAATQIASLLETVAAERNPYRS